MEHVSALIPTKFAFTLMLSLLFYVYPLMFCDPMFLFFSATFLSPKIQNAISKSQIFIISVSTYVLCSLPFLKRRLQTTDLETELINICDFEIAF